jgi:integrase
MVEGIGGALGDLKTRGAHTAKNDLVFVSREGTHVDGSALRRRYLATLEAAGLRQLRFHDLRHTFGSLAINVASIVQVQAWMGHARENTTPTTCDSTEHTFHRSASVGFMLPICRMPPGQ